MFKRLLGYGSNGSSGLNDVLWNELSDMPGLLLVVTDESFNLEWANDYFYEYFQCRQTETVGRPMHDFLGDDVQCGMNEEHIVSLLAKGRIWDHKARTIGADGEYVVIRWNQRVLKEKNKILKILSVGFPPKTEDDGDSNPKGQVPAVPSPSRDAWGFNLQQKNTPNMGKEEKQEAELELENCMSKENFLLHYQPRVDARTKAIIGAEALVRMQHSEHGILYPASFLPMAEKRGQIIEIGSYVLDAACKKLHEWQNSGSELMLTISINLSPRQLYDEEIVQTLLSAVSRHRIDPSNLMLELTERTIATYYDNAKRIMQTLKDTGFKVAVDDYSAEFLPIASLVRLPMDNIAFDRYLLAQSDINPAVNSVIESIILLAHGINITVTASGIENRRQLDFLIDNSVDFLQGYLISEPLPEAEFDRFIMTNPDFYTRHI